MQEKKSMKSKKLETVNGRNYGLQTSQVPTQQPQSKLDPKA